MSSLAPLLRDQRKVDAEHLNLLAIFHFVMAGLALIGLGFLFLHFTFMSQMFLHAENWNHGPRPNAPPQEFFMVMKWFYGVFGGILILGGVGNLLSGLFIRQRKNRVFSLIVAGLNCLHLPMGIALGIFTFLVLLRDSVRELYEFQAGTAPAPTPADPLVPQPQNPMPLIRPEDRPPVVAVPPPVAAPQGDATGGIIPYKNPPALMAYYAGVFSVIPFFGFFIGIAAFCLGIVGLKRRRQTPIIRGSVHAWIGIIAGGLSVVVHLLVVVMLIVGSNGRR